MEEESFIEAELTDYLLKMFMEHWEIEILQGERTKLANGNTLCKFELSGESKILMEKFVKALVATPSDQLTVKYMGQKINPN